MALASIVATQSWFGHDSQTGKRRRLVAFVGFALICTCFGFWALLLGWDAGPYTIEDPWIPPRMVAVNCLYIAGPGVSELLCAVCDALPTPGRPRLAPS